jgi:hypothetical protein
MLVECFANSIKMSIALRFSFNTTTAMFGAIG